MGFNTTEDDHEAIIGAPGQSLHMKAMSNSSHLS